MNNIENIHKIGLAGLGLMGQGISACLVAHGYEVIAYSRTRTREGEALMHIEHGLKKLIDRGIISEFENRDWKERFRYVGDLKELGESDFVIETVGEDLDLKRHVYGTLESVIGPDVVIGTNTSGMPVSLLQESLSNKQRFIGMHWGEPAEVSQYLEIAPGKETNQHTVDLTRMVGSSCSKVPTVLNFEVPGLISNRLMYAMMREAIHLLESGVADIETIDRSFRNDIGWWATIFGPFRWMDLTGLKTYAKVMEGLFPDLSNKAELPGLMREKAESGSLFYNYDKTSLEEWEEVWKDFTLDIREISLKYNRKINLDPPCPGKI
jgi:3-hydroxybutyryl-CoA dehydrogenase